MQVYKAYFKIMKQNLPAISIYIGIFLLLTIMLTYLYNEKINPEFVQTKSNIAFINHDGNTVVTAGLKDYLNEKTNIVSIPDTTESLQDALFFRKVTYIVKIPQGFSASFLNGNNDIKIQKTTVQDSVSSVHIDFLINRYLSTVNLYQQNMPGETDFQLYSYVKKNVDRQSQVHVKNYGQTADHKVARYYTYAVYAMIVIIFLGVSSIMMVFNDTDLRRRNLGSPLKPFQLNMQILMGNLSFALLVWIIMVAIGFLFAGKIALDITSLLLYINFLCLTLVCLSLSFLIGNLISSRDVQQAVANVLSLGLCFISGVFVPQQLLGHTINFMASFTPTYWYVKAVNDIEKLVLVTNVNITPIVNSILIQLGFVLALLIVALAIAKQKQA